MKQYEWISNSEEETADFAYRLAEKLKSSDTITLEGDLGAGKTTFTKALAKGLGVTRTVNSPTFTIIKEYQGRVPFYHMDVYRLASEDEDLGFEEYFNGEGVTVVEWAHLIESQLPSERLNIHIYRVDETSRRIVVKAYGDRYANLCEEIFS